MSRIIPNANTLRILVFGAKFYLLALQFPK